MENKPEHDPLEDAPLLRSIRRDDPFEVPEGFFDRFPHKVQARIARKHQGLLERFGPLLVKPSFAVAAIAIVAVIALLVIPPSGNDHAGRSVATGPELDLAPEELLALYGDGDELLDELGPSPVLVSDIGAGFSGEELAAYLDHEDIPFELLIEEL